MLSSSVVTIQVSEKTYLKNPESSELGRKIVQGSIDMIYELGFESFTFRKLGGEISSNEASVYRYFESKHKLLLYLTSWYWNWMGYRLALNLANIESPEERLDRAVKQLTEPVTEDGHFAHINEVKLHHIVITESSKAYLTREVDKENKEGLFAPYKSMVAAVSDIILEINPNFKYPHMLVSTMIEGSHYQRYFAEHLPRLTDIVPGEDAITTFYKQMVLKSIN